MNRRQIRTILKYTTIVLVVIAVFILTSFAVMLLWNWLMPVIFGLPKITYLQSLGLSLLCDLLFKSHKYDK